MDISFNLLALIPFFFFLLLYKKIRKKGNNHGSILIGLYLVGSIFAVFLDLEVGLPLHNKFNEAYYNFIFYTILLVVFLIPAFWIRRIESISELHFFKQKSIFLIILSLFAWFSFLYLMPFAFASMAMDSVNVRTGLGTGDISVLPKNIFTTLATGVASFYPIFVFLFYMSYAQKRHLFITISMFVGGLSYVISTLAFAGRDGIIFFTIILIIFYKFFEKVLEKKHILKYKKIFYVLSILSFILLIRISSERFERSEGVYSTIQLGIIGYGGMQPFIFNDILNDFNNYNYGNSSFSVIKEIFNMEVSESPEAEEAMEWQFGTFLTSFYKASGLTSMLLISLVYLIVFYGLIPKVNNAKLPFRMIVVGFYYQFMVTGFFYFRLGNNAGNIYTVILVLLFIFLLFRYRGITKIKER